MSTINWCFCLAQCTWLYFCKFFCFKWDGVPGWREVMVRVMMEWRKKTIGTDLIMKLNSNAKSNSTKKEGDIHVILQSYKTCVKVFTKLLLITCRYMKLPLIGLFTTQSYVRFVTTNSPFFTDKKGGCFVASRWIFRHLKKRDPHQRLLQTSLYKLRNMRA